MSKRSEGGFGALRERMTILRAADTLGLRRSMEFLVNMGRETRGRLVGGAIKSWFSVRLAARAGDVID